MKVLILTAFYPIPGGTHERMFVHVRNQYYQRHGINVTVLNFDAKKEYEIDGIKVITLNDYVVNKNSERYDILISHSANLRNHYRFIRKFGNAFQHFVFFFHGHEMLYLNKDYPIPYPYMKNSKWYHQIMQNAYDSLKIRAWAKYYQKIASKSDFVFVSEWIHRRFMKNTGLGDADLQNRIHVINNSVGEVFEKYSYVPHTHKSFDFITIRSNLDGSQYCIDLLLEFACKYPDKKFLLIGKGRFFEYHNQPENLKWIEKTINHEEMIGYLNNSKCALMMTREDTQGVMTCEMETFGIPTITSDIEVCREFFNGMTNVRMIPNDTSLTDINMIAEQLNSFLPCQKDKRFFAENTVKQEVALLKSIEKGH